MDKKKYHFDVRLVIAADSQEQAESELAKRMNRWMHSSINHNSELVLINGDLIYWDISVKHVLMIPEKQKV